MTARIGLVGAGLMGFGIGVRLIAAGFPLTVVAHRNRAPVEALVAKGAAEAADVESLAARCDIVILCLSNSAAVEQVVGRITPHLAAGAIIIDTGTSDPNSTRRLAAGLAARGVAFADAPMTGGPEQAEKGEVGVLLGADPATERAILPVLNAFAARVAHFGPPGAGHAAKLVSNYLVTGMIALVADAFRAADESGVDRAKLYGVMTLGSGNSGVLRKMAGPAIEHGDYDGYRFALANAAKDLGYYRKMAGDGGFLSPLAEQLGETYRHHLETHDGEANVSRLIEPATRRRKSRAMPP
jgi:3-hydroxyisobutyrate dehydrogenase-like beta-hydroxyacid dehydrogenase